MENNKQYNTSKKVRFSMLMAMLVLSSLFTARLRASDLGVSDTVLSRRSSKPICHYFKEIPKNKDFQWWREEVMKIVHSYELEKTLAHWIKDVEKLEKIIISLHKEGKSNMRFVAMIEQHQIKGQNNASMICGYYPQPSLGDQSGKLENIGNLSSGEFVSVDPTIAVIDELYRESMRNWHLLSNSKGKELRNLCLKIAQKKHKDKIVKMLTFDPLKELASGVSSAASNILSMFTGNTVQGEKDNKNN